MPRPVLCRLSPRLSPFPTELPTRRLPPPRHRLLPLFPPTPPARPRTQVPRPHLALRLSSRLTPPFREFLLPLALVLPLHLVPVATLPHPRTSLVRQATTRSLASLRVLVLSLPCSSKCLKTWWDKTVLHLSIFVGEIELHQKMLDLEVFGDRREVSGMHVYTRFHGTQSI